MKLGDLARELGGELRGDAELEVTGVKGIEEAGPTEVTFVANPKYTGLARKTQAAAVLVDPDFQEIEAATLRIKNPYLAFSRALGLFYQPPVYSPGIHPTAVIDPTSVIGEGAHIGAYVVVGPKVRVGCSRNSFAPCGTLSRRPKRAHTRLPTRTRWCGKTAFWGDHVTLENGAIVGVHRFGFAKNEAGHWEKIPGSRARCGFGDRVDVQANACIDRATVGETSIGNGTKVDNLVQIGHGSKVGDKHTGFARRRDWLFQSVIGNNVDSGWPDGRCRALHRWATE